ncbi:MAG: Hsp20 family protein [Clostridia bacterium]|nr:Hsp20 family protein [Clostridia bacterium]
MKGFLSRLNDNDWGYNFFDDTFGDFFKPVVFAGNNGYMRTDVKQADGGVELSVDLPGFDKKDINLTLDGGYLKVSAKSEEKEEGKSDYVFRERVRSCSRSFYVGDAVKEEDVKAKYDKGILTIFVPKKDKQIEEKKNIFIE